MPGASKVYITMSAHARSVRMPCSFATHQLAVLVRTMKIRPAAVKLAQLQPDAECHPGGAHEQLLRSQAQLGQHAVARKNTHGWGRCACACRVCLALQLKCSSPWEAGRQHKQSRAPTGTQSVRTLRLHQARSSGERTRH